MGGRRAEPDAAAADRGQGGRGRCHVFPGVTTTTNFAVVGAQGATIPTTIAALDTTNFAVRYDAGVDAYIVDLPYLPEGKFRSNGSNNDFWFGGIEGNCCAVITMLKPFPTTTRIQLTYTTYATFYDYDFHDFAPFGVFAFGTATPAGSVPTTGSATYDAIVAGLTIDRGFDVNGSAALHFDFGAGTLAGSMLSATTVGRPSAISCSAKRRWLSRLEASRTISSASGRRSPC